MRFGLQACVPKCLNRSRTPHASSSSLIPSLLVVQDLPVRLIPWSWMQIGKPPAAPYAPGVMEAWVHCPSSHMALCSLTGHEKEPPPFLGGRFPLGTCLYLGCCWPLCTPKWLTFCGFQLRKTSLIVSNTGGWILSVGSMLSVDVVRFFMKHHDSLHHMPSCG